jgi:type I restriction enzyme, S subunit
MPAHWDFFPIKRELQFLTSGSRGWADHYADEGPLFIRIGNLTRDDVGLDLSDIQRVQIPQGSEGERTRVQPGDVLFSITAYIGSVAVVPENLETAYVIN